MGAPSTDPNATAARTALVDGSSDINGLDGERRYTKKASSRATPPLTFATTQGLFISPATTIDTIVQARSADVSVPFKAALQVLSSANEILLRSLFAPALAVVVTVIRTPHRGRTVIFLALRPVRRLRSPESGAFEEVRITHLTRMYGCPCGGALVNALAVLVERELRCYARVYNEGGVYPLHFNRTREAYRSFELQKESY